MDQQTLNDHLDRMEHAVCDLPPAHREPIEDVLGAIVRLVQSVLDDNQDLRERLGDAMCHLSRLGRQLSEPLRTGVTQPVQLEVRELMRLDRPMHWGTRVLRRRTSA